MVFRLFLVLALLQPVTPILAAEPDAVAITSPAIAEAQSAWRKGLTFLRIHFLASDEELPDIRQAIHEAEHALEPPTQVEGFWARKLEILRHPVVALDLRRSFQNARRLARISNGFERKQVRGLLASATTMFTGTHGGEVLMGTSLGLWHTFQAFGQVLAADFGEAASQAAIAGGAYGLALPGLYDFGCWIGALVLTVRPTRYAFNQGRKAVVFAAGKGAQVLGIPKLMEAVFTYEPARKRLQAALESSEHATIDIRIQDADLLTFDFSDSNSRVLNLRFEESANGELILRNAEVDPLSLKEMPYAQLRDLLSPFGWNVLGVFRQIRKLILRNQTDLIAEEKTFVDKVESSPSGALSIDFRMDSVWAGPTRVVRDTPHPRACAGQVAAHATVK